MKGDANAAERGMTLPELLIAVALLGIITFAISTVLLVTIGPDQQAASRLAVAHDSQLVSLYLPDDVQSAGPISASDVLPGAAANCPGLPDGTPNVLRLSWSQLGTTYAVNYRIVERDGEIQLVRYSCTNSRALEELVVAHELASTSAASVGPLQGRRVVLTLTVGPQDDPQLQQTITITGIRRTPSAVCVVLNHSISSVTAAQTTSGTTLASPPSVTVDTDGPCGGLRLHYNRGSGNQVLAFTTAGVATLPSGETWEVGTYTLTITGGTEIATDTFTVVPPPCTLANLTATPSPVALDASGNLASPVAVSVTTTGECASLEIAYQRRAADSEQVVQLGGVAPYTATIPVAGPWTPDSTVSLIVRDTGGGTQAGASSFQVTHYTPCSVSAVTPNPTNVSRDAANQLSQPVAVAVTAAGACGPLVMDVTGGPVDLSLGAGPAYSGTIPVAGNWTLGGHTISVRRAGQPAVLGTGSLNVVQCAVTSISASPNPVSRQGGGSLSRLANPVTITVVTSGSSATSGMQLAIGAPQQPASPAPALAGGPTNWTFVIPAMNSWQFNANRNVPITVTVGGAVYTGSFRVS